MLVAVTDLDPLTPAPAEVVVTIVGVGTLLFCAFVLIQMLRERWTVRVGLSFIAMAVILPVAGPLLAFWLMHRSRPDPAPVAR